MIDKNKLIEESIESLTNSMVESYKKGEELEVFSTSNFTTPTSVYALLKTIETIAENDSIPNDNLAALLHSTIDLISKLKEKPENYIDEDNIEDSILASLLEKTGLAYPDNSKLDKPSLFEIAFEDKVELKKISERLMDNALDLSLRENVENEINDNRKVNADALLNVNHVFLNEENQDKLTALYLEEKNKNDVDFEYKAYGALFSLYEDSKDKDKVSELGLTSDQVERLEKYIDKIINNPNLDVNKLNKYKDEYSTVNFVSFHYTEDVLKKLLKEERELNNGVWSKTPYKNNITDEDLTNEELEEEERLKKYYIDNNQRYLDFLEKNNLFILNSSQKIKNKIPGVPISLIPGAPIGVGLGAIGSNLLGTSIVDENNVCLFNISPLTGSFKFTTPGESSKNSYIVAALAARKNGWNTVHLNYNGNDQAAISFFQNSIDSLVKYGGYSYDDIQLPRKYMPILEAMKMKGGEFSPEPIENIANQEENVLKNNSIKSEQETNNELENKNNSTNENKPKIKEKEKIENITTEQEEALSSFSEDLFSDLDSFRNEIDAEEPSIRFKDIDLEEPNNKSENKENKINSEEKNELFNINEDLEEEDLIGYNSDYEEYLNSVEEEIESNKNKNKKDNRNRPI